MIFNDDVTSTYQQRVDDTIDYLKYCLHKARKLNSADRLQLLQHCMVDRISRMPDDNEKLMNSLKKGLAPCRNLSLHAISTGTLGSLNLENPSTVNAVNNTDDVNDKGNTNTAEIKNTLDINRHAKNVVNEKALNDIIKLFYDSDPLTPNTVADHPTPQPETQKVEDIIGTLLLLANRLKDTEYRLIDILPLLGDAFETKEDIIKNVLNETIETMFRLLDVDKFHDVKLKPSMNSPIKRKAFLFDLLSQSFQRTKNQHEKGIYLEQALELYRQKLKTMGIN